MLGHWFLLLQGMALGPIPPFLLALHLLLLTPAIIIKYFLLISCSYLLALRWWQHPCWLRCTGGRPCKAKALLLVVLPMCSWSPATWGCSSLVLRQRLLQWWGRQGRGPFRWLLPWLHGRCLLAPVLVRLVWSSRVLLLAPLLAPLMVLLLLLLLSLGLPWYLALHVPRGLLLLLCLGNPLPLLTLLLRLRLLGRPLLLVRMLLLVWWRLLLWWHRPQPGHKHPLIMEVEGGCCCRHGSASLFPKGRTGGAVCVAVALLAVPDEGWVDCGLHERGGVPHNDLQVQSREHLGSQGCMSCPTV